MISVQSAIEFALAALGFGFVWGYVARLLQTRKVRGARLVQRHEVIVPGIRSVDAVQAEEWRLALSAFTMWTERTGMSECAAINSGLCSGRAYRRLTEVLKDNGILVATERGKTRYTPGWSGPKLRSWLRRRKITLDLPPAPPPTVNVPHLPERVYADVADGRRCTQRLDIVGASAT